MNLNDYQQEALKTAIYPEQYKIIYAALGLGNEAGEVQGKIKKWLRGDDGATMSEERRQDLKGELGDVLWYLAVLSSELGFNLDEVAQHNVEKLRSRSERNRLHGDGGER